MLAAGPATSHLPRDRCYINISPLFNIKLIARNFIKVRCLKKKKKSKEIQPIGRNSGLKRKSAYRRKLMERSIRAHPYVRKPISSLRSTPAIIPLEATMPQADPRTDPKVSFLDLIEVEEEINGDGKTTKETCNEEAQSKVEVRKNTGI